MARNDRLLKALRREPVDRTPVWFMRQAGRYQAEYRRIREKTGILEIVRTPDLAVEVTLLPLHEMAVDAAILCSDIMVPLAPMGLPFRIDEGHGPKVETPIAGPADVARLRPLEPEQDLPHVLETVRILARELAGDRPLLGFAGAPFTLASYAIEGGPSRSFARTKAFMYREPDAWHALLEKLATAAAAYLAAQVAAGADALQVFDSWVGCLSTADYRAYVLPHMRRLFGRLGKAGVAAPVIHFGVETGDLLELMAEAGGDAIGVDWRKPIGRAWRRVGHGRAIQGNLDPAALLGPWEVVERAALDVLGEAGGRPGHVFNLGHGVLPETPPDALRRLADLVHERSPESIARFGRFERFPRFERADLRP